MGMGLILVIVALVAGYFLARKFGWLNVVLTLGNSAQSRFSRSSSDDGSTFKVTPARASRAALASIALGLLILSFTSLGAITALGLIPLVMGLMAFLIGARHRHAATISVSADEVRSGDSHWPRSDIADFNIRRGSRIKTDEPAPSVHLAANGGLYYGGKPTSLMFSRGLNRRAVERSYLLTLRTQSGSAETVLCGGLTLDCANALRNDLNEEIEAQ